MPLEKSAENRWPIALAALWSLWLLLLLFFPISHNDTWWHVKCGEWVWQHLSFPAKDPFSYSSPDTSWLKESSLFNVLAYLVFRSQGASGLISAKLIVAFTSAALTLSFSIKRGASWCLCLSFLTLSFLASRFYWTERPQSTASLFFVVAILVLDMKRGTLREVLLLGTGIFWVNLSGSAILFPALAAAYEFGNALSGKIFNWKSPLICFLATLLSPQFDADYLDVTNFYGPKEAMRVLITEWKAPVLSQNPSLLILFLILPVLLYFCWRSKSWAASLILLATAAAAFHVGRMIPFFALAMGLWGPPLLSESLVAKKNKLEIGLALLLTAFLLAHCLWILRWERLGGPMIDETQFPIQAAAFLANERPQGHLGNLYRDGSYLLFRLGPQTKVFIDSREYNYPSKVFLAAVALEHGSPQWKKIVQDYNFSCMLLPLQSRLTPLCLADKNWELVYFDDNFIIVSTDQERLFHQGRWPWYRGVNPLTAGVNDASQETVVQLQQRLSLQRADAKGYYLLGLACEERKMIPAAKEALAKSLELDPSQDAVGAALLNLNK
jgi:hypothetical protein